MSDWDWIDWQGDDFEKKRQAYGRWLRGLGPEDPGLGSEEPFGATRSFGQRPRRTAFEEALDRATAPSTGTVRSEPQSASPGRYDFGASKQAYEQQKHEADLWATFLDVGIYSRDPTRLQQQSATPVEGYQTYDPMSALRRQAGRILRPRPAGEATRAAGLAPGYLTEAQISRALTRQSNILDDFVQDVGGVDPNAPVGVHIHRKMAYDPGALPGSSGWEQMMGAYMGWGFTEAQLEERLSHAGIYGPDVTAREASSFLSRSLAAEYGGAPPFEIREAEHGGLGVTQSAGQWKYTPSAKQMMYRAGVTGAALGKDVSQMDPRDWPEGMVTRQGSARVWPARLYTSIWGGPHEGEDILSTYDPSDRAQMVKLTKRLRLQGVYKGMDYFSESGQEITAEAPIYLGSASMRRERGVVTKEMVSLGEWLPEGMRLRAQGSIGYVGRQLPYDIPIPEDFELKDVPKKGTRWMRESGGVQLFAGSSPLNLGLGRNWDWAELKDWKDVRAKVWDPRKEEYREQRVFRAIMQLGATPETARLSDKTFSSKFMGAVGQPELYHGQAGYGLTQIKEPTQLAFSWWAAHPNEMLEAVQQIGPQYKNLTMEQMREMDWNPVSKPLYEKYRTEVLPQIYTEQTMNIPSVHRSELEYYGLSEEKLQGDVWSGEHIGGEQYKLTSNEPMPFLKGEFFQMPRRGWAGREPVHLPFREVQRLKRVAKGMEAERPAVAEFYKSVLAQGLPYQQAYQGIIQASIAGQQGVGFPRGTSMPNIEDVQATVMAAREKLMGGGDQEPLRGALAREVMQMAAQTEWGQKPILTSQGVLAAPAHAQRFFATTAIGEEATRYGSQYGEFLLNYADPAAGEARDLAARQALVQQVELSEGEKFLRQALGTFLPSGFGGPAVSSEALGAEEMVAPVERVLRALGMDPTQVGIEGTREHAFEQKWRAGMRVGGQVLGQPMPGDWPLAGLLNVLHPEYAAEQRGVTLSPQTGMVVSQKYAEAMGRDFDEDFMTALLHGTASKEGQFMLPGQKAPGGEGGLPWFTAEQLAERAREAKEIGRPSHVRAGKYTNLEALQAAMDPANLHRVSAEQIRESMGFTRKLRQYIGPAYASLEDIERTARGMDLGEEAQQFFGAVHGKTQTPELLSEPMQKVMGMLNTLHFSAWGGKISAGYFDKLTGGTFAEATRQQLQISGGPTGIATAFLPELMKEEGLKPSLVAQLAFPRENWAAAEEHIKAWRKAGPDERVNLAAQTLRLAGGGMGFATQTPIGLTAMSMALGRGKSEHTKEAVEQIKKALPPEMRELFENTQARNAAWRQAISKRGDIPLFDRIAAGMFAEEGMFSPLTAGMGELSPETQQAAAEAGIDLGLQPEPATAGPDVVASAEAGPGGYHPADLRGSSRITGFAPGDPRARAVYGAARAAQLAKYHGYGSVKDYYAAEAAAARGESVTPPAGGAAPPAPPSPPAPPAPPGPSDPNDPNIPDEMMHMAGELRKTMSWAFGTTPGKFRTGVRAMMEYGAQYGKAAEAVRGGAPVTPGFRQATNQMLRWFSSVEGGLKGIDEKMPGYESQELQDFEAWGTALVRRWGSELPEMSVLSERALMQERLGSVLPEQQELTGLGMGFLNYASEQQLQGVSGIGPKIASRIVSARQQLAQRQEARIAGAPTAVQEKIRATSTMGFRSASDVLSVAGIGEKSLASMTSALEEAGLGLAQGGGVADHTKLLTERMQAVSKSLDQWSKEVEPAIKGTEELNKTQKQWMDVLSKELSGMGREALSLAKHGHTSARDVMQQIVGSDAYQTLTEAQQQDYLKAIEGLGQPAGAAGGGGFRTSIFGAEGPLQGADRIAGSLVSGWRLMMMRRLWGMTGGVAMGNIPVAAGVTQAATGAAAATMPIGGLQVSDMGLGLMESQALKQAGQAQMGEAAYRAYGGVQRFMAGATGGALSGIGLPALGVGGVAGTLAMTLGGSFLGFGLPAAAIAGAYGLYQYGESIRSDEQQMALNMATGTGMYSQPSGGVPGAGGLTQAPADQSAQMLMQMAQAQGVPIPTLTGEGQFDIRAALREGPTEFTEQEWARAQRGYKMMAGNIYKIPEEDRAAAIQYAVEEFRPEGVSEQQAAQFLQEYIASVSPDETMTMGRALQSPLAREQFYGGMSISQYKQIAGQMGYLTSGWQKARDLIQGQGLLQQDVVERMEIGGRWGAATRLGISGTDIMESAVMGQLPEVSSQALGNFVGQIGQMVPIPGFGGMSNASWAARVGYAGTRMAQARATGDYTGGWGENTMWGIQDAMTAENTRYQQASAGLSMARINAERQYLWGAGTPLQPGEGSMWAMQDISRQFGYVQQMGGISPISGQQYTGAFNFSAMQANMSFANTQASAAQSLRQTMENLGLSREIYMAQWNWDQKSQEDRAEELARQRERSGVQYGWQMTDWWQQAGRSSIEFGWRMEDYEENIRRSTGWEREQLIKRQGRDVTRRGWEVTDLQEEKDRLEQRREWELEDFELKEEQLEELKEKNLELHKLRLEQFKQREEHAKEDHSLRMEQARASHELQMQQLEERKAAYQEEFEHQQEIQDLQREHQAEQLDFQEQAAGMAAAHAKAMQELSDKYTSIQRALSTIALDFDETVIDGLLKLLREARQHGVAGGFVSLAGDNPGSLPYGIE